ncbi:hypothetical protein BHE74_00004588 [Ensete ventricosum]|nr:hypothetical protein BHE74_00004588 [Ensete ventricosum]RZR82781.1 hypothetical protein BHM03_00009265 [Ensete ventricosum]
MGVTATVRAVFKGNETVGLPDVTQKLKPDSFRRRIHMASKIVPTASVQFPPFRSPTVSRQESTWPPPPRAVTLDPLQVL